MSAVIVAGEDSRALIEAADGKQAWYRVGQSLGDLRIYAIENQGIKVESAEGRFVLALRGDSRLSRISAPQPPPPPPQEVSRPVDFRNLSSRIAAVAPMRGESEEKATARNLNQVLGLADQARITAVDRERVASATEARNRLLDRLRENEAIRITVAGDDVRMLYVVPEN